MPIKIGVRNCQIFHQARPFGRIGESLTETQYSTQASHCLNLASLASNATRGNSGVEVRSTPYPFRKKSKLEKSPTRTALPSAVEIRAGNGVGMELVNSLVPSKRPRRKESVH